jgi:hypothetical protein
LADAVLLEIAEIVAAEQEEGPENGNLRDIGADRQGACGVLHGDIVWWNEILEKATVEIEAGILCRRRHATLWTSKAGARRRNTPEKKEKSQKHRQ